MTFSRTSLMIVSLFLSLTSIGAQASCTYSLSWFGINNRTIYVKVDGTTQVVCSNPVLTKPFKDGDIRAASYTCSNSQKGFYQWYIYDREARAFGNQFFLVTDNGYTECSKEK